MPAASNVAACTVPCFGLNKLQWLHDVRSCFAESSFRWPLASSHFRHQLRHNANHTCFTKRLEASLLCPVSSRMCLSTEGQPVIKHQAALFNSCCRPSEAGDVASAAFVKSAGLHEGVVNFLHTKQALSWAGPATELTVTWNA